MKQVKAYQLEGGLTLETWAQWLRERRFIHAADYVHRGSTRLLPRHMALPNAAMNHYFMGRMDKASDAIEATLRTPMPAQWFPLCINKVCCVDVAAGRYQRTLAYRARLRPEVFAECADAMIAEAYRGEEEVLRVNEAEALANLGKLRESLELLTGAFTRPMGRTAASLHRTWVFALLGEVQAAASEFQSAGVMDMPTAFRSEYYFAEAFLRIVQTDLAAAAHAVEQGERVAVRASSRRNALFLRATIAVNRGEKAQAIRLFEQGAKHVYKGQGGHALLAWGNLLQSMGRTKQAIQAWNLVQTRDPESQAAEQAKSLLHAHV